MLATKNKPNLLVAATQRIPQTSLDGQIVGTTLSVANFSTGVAKACQCYDLLVAMCYVFQTSLAIAAEKGSARLPAAEAIGADSAARFHCIFASLPKIALCHVPPNCNPVMEFKLQLGHRLPEMPSEMAA